MDRHTTTDLEKEQGQGWREDPQWNKLMALHNEIRDLEKPLGRYCESHMRLERGSGMPSSDLNSAENQSFQETPKVVASLRMLTTSKGLTATRQKSLNRVHHQKRSSGRSTWTKSRLLGSSSWYEIQ